MKSESHRERHSIAFDVPRTRWYQHALRRLPVSLPISLVTLLLGVPLLLWLTLTIYGWIAG
ncbi:MAG: hypothetical protein H8E66_07960 [Planctomycetes bacterium]|nr:hypothetical protein [Planctomycetota bacterium]